jgi:hypothetical protein
MGCVSEGIVYGSPKHSPKMCNVGGNGVMAMGVVDPVRRM